MTIYFSQNKKKLNEIKYFIFLNLKMRYRCNMYFYDGNITLERNGLYIKLYELKRNGKEVRTNKTAVLVSIIHIGSSSM